LPDFSGGTGEPNDPYLLSKEEELNRIGHNPRLMRCHFKVVADLDLEGFPYYQIGDYDHPYNGVVDGNGKTIRNLSHTLFGCVGGVIKNLRLLDPNCIGSPVEDNYGTISCCSVQGGSVSGAGGLVGGNSGTVTGCHSTATVTGYGGLVGSNYGGTVTYCYSTGAVTGKSYVGGLVGSNWYAGHVSNCYSSGSVTGTEDCVGGLVGANFYSFVTNCYSTGSVTGTESVGGLVGVNWGTEWEHGRTITNSYAAGRVSGSEHAGGLVGSFRDSVVVNSFWDMQMSDQATSAGGTGKTTAEMQMASMFLDAGWDFVGETANGTEDIWWILEGKDYPRLWWQLPADDFEDGEPEPLWFVYEVDPDLVQIREVNGRLETVASAQAQNVDAFYVSDGWRLDVTKEFAIRVDFHFSKQGGGDGRVTLGVIPSLDPSAMQWAELEAGCFDTGPFYLYEVRDRTWVQERVADRFSDGGTLYMSYNPDTDELYFSHSGYGKANAWQTVTGLLKGRWASEPVYVILGGGSDQVILDAGDAYLDNFVVDSGLLDFSATPDDTGTEEP
jgi:hypothetical protein